MTYSSILVPHFEIWIGTPNLTASKALTKCGCCNHPLHRHWIAIYAAFFADNWHESAKNWRTKQWTKQIESNLHKFHRCERRKWHLKPLEGDFGARIPLLALLDDPFYTHSAPLLRGLHHLPPTGWSLQICGISNSWRVGQRAGSTGGAPVLGLGNGFVLDHCLNYFSGVDGLCLKLKWVKWALYCQNVL